MSRRRSPCRYSHKSLEAGVAFGDEIVPVEQQGAEILLGVVGELRMGNQQFLDPLLLAAQKKNDRLSSTGYMPRVSSSSRQKWA